MSLFSALSTIRMMMVGAALVGAVGFAAGVILKKHIKTYIYKKEIKDTTQEWECLKTAKTGKGVLECKKRNSKKQITGKEVFFRCCKFMGFSFFVLLIFGSCLFLGTLVGGCAGITGQNPLANNPQSQGFIAGAATTKAVDKLKEFTKTKYQLFYPAQEICTFNPIHENFVDQQALVPDYLENPEQRQTLQEWFVEKEVTVTCFLAPCSHGENCQREESFATFLARNNGNFHRCR